MLLNISNTRTRIQHTDKLTVVLLPHICQRRKSATQHGSLQAVILSSAVSQIRPKGGRAGNGARRTNVTCNNSQQARGYSPIT